MLSLFQTFNSLTGSPSEMPGALKASSISKMLLELAADEIMATYKCGIPCSCEWSKFSYGNTLLEISMHHQHGSSDVSLSVDFSDVEEGDEITIYWGDVDSAEDIIIMIAEGTDADLYNIKRSFQNFFCKKNYHIHAYVDELNNTVNLVGRPGYVASSIAVDINDTFTHYSLSRDHEIGEPFYGKDANVSLLQERAITIISSCKEGDVSEDASFVRISNQDWLPQPGDDEFGDGDSFNDSDLPVAVQEVPSISDDTITLDGVNSENEEFYRWTLEDNDGSTVLDDTGFVESTDILSGNYFEGTGVSPTLDLGDLWNDLEKDPPESGFNLTPGANQVEIDTPTLNEGYPSGSLLSVDYYIYAADGVTLVAFLVDASSSETVDLSAHIPSGGVESFYIHQHVQNADGGISKSEKYITVPSDNAVMLSNLVVTPSGNSLSSSNATTIAWTYNNIIGSPQAYNRMEVTYLDTPEEENAILTETVIFSENTSPDAEAALVSHLVTLPVPTIVASTIYAKITVTAGDGTSTDSISSIEPFSVIDGNTPPSVLAPDIASPNRTASTMTVAPAVSSQGTNGSVTFSSAGASAHGDSIRSYLWNFGDGNTSREANPTHVYAYPGPKVATLRVVDNAGYSKTESVSFTVNNFYYPVVWDVLTNTELSFRGGVRAVQGATPNWNVNGAYTSTSYLRNILGSYEIKFRYDGGRWSIGLCTHANSGFYYQTNPYLLGVTVDSSSLSPIYNEGSTGSSIALADNDIVRLVFTEVSGDQQMEVFVNDVTQGTTTCNINQSSNVVLMTSIRNVPTGPFDVQTFGFFDESLNAPTANYTATPADPADRSYTFADTSTGTPVSWEWDFGDGSSSTLQNPTHKFISSGSHDVSLTVRSATGEQSTHTTSILVVGNDILSSGSIISLQYIWSDPDGDGQQTQVQLYRYSDAAGTADETLISSVLATTSESDNEYSFLLPILPSTYYVKGRITGSDGTDSIAAVETAVFEVEPYTLSVVNPYFTSTPRVGVATGFAVEEFLSGYDGEDGSVINVYSYTSESDALANTSPTLVGTFTNGDTWTPVDTSPSLLRCRIGYQGVSGSASGTEVLSDVYIIEPASIASFSGVSGARAEYNFADGPALTDDLGNMPAIVAASGAPYHDSDLGAYLHDYFNEDIFRLECDAVGQEIGSQVTTHFVFEIPHESVNTGNLYYLYPNAKGPMIRKQSNTDPIKLGFRNPSTYEISIAGTEPIPSQVYVASVYHDGTGIAYLYLNGELQGSTNTFTADDDYQFLYLFGTGIGANECPGISHGFYIQQGIANTDFQIRQISNFLMERHG